jgi:hypothetical protein
MKYVLFVTKKDWLQNAMILGKRFATIVTDIVELAYVPIVTEKAYFKHLNCVVCVTNVNKDPKKSLLVLPKDHKKS